MSKKKEFRLSDNVLRRIVQIIQEGFLTGTDVVDHMRLIKVQQSKEEPDQLELTQEYVEYVEKTHEQLLQFAKDHAGEVKVDG
jgi:hypothetical protein